MTLRSLLSTVVVVGAGVSAYAFPTMTVNPAADKTYDSAQMFATFNLTPAGGEKITINEGEWPSLENLDTGDQLSCERFYYWDMAQAVMINFDSSSITENGEWQLTIPAGCMQDASGETNEEMVYTYNLNDKTLNIGDFPQITLISSDPANGAKLPYWGDTLGKVTFQTSDDAAVNYIDWSLWDITNGTEDGQREWIRQGNESRFDINRTGSKEIDQFADGLFIAVSGSTQLIAGHTYRLYLKFCGIGWDPETMQYPTPIEQAQSLELETYIDYQGQIAATEYSPYTVKSISPDPETYDFDNIDMRTFTIYYTGPVKPDQFIYSMGMVGTASAGSYTPATEANADGYADAWDFTFDKSVLSDITGSIFVTIEVKDADGLYVKGNKESDQDNFSYGIEWECNLGADVLVSVLPENGATVEQLSVITVSNEAGKTMAYSHLTTDRPQIVSMSRAGTQIAIDLDEPEISADGKQATWTFDPITTSGTYSLIIPKQYFNIGEEFAGTVSNQTSFTYIVEGEEEPSTGDVSYTLEPASVSVAEGAVLTEPLTKFVLTFSKVTYCPMDVTDMKAAKLYRQVTSAARADEYELVEEVYSDTGDDFMNPKVYTYTFSKPVEENGNYKFVIPQGSFFDETYDFNAGEAGTASPEMTYLFSVEIENGVDAIAAENGIVTVYDVAGRVVLNNAPAAGIKALAPGMYIVNGKKVMVK